jgi:hypothetical protein
MLALIGAAVHEGIGIVHATPLETAAITKLIVANNDVWAVLVNATKVSIVMQYLRIFSGQTTRALCYILLCTLFPAALWAVLGGTLLCTPVSKLWEPWIYGRCISAEAYWISVAVIDIDLDIFVLTLPIPAVMDLRLSRRQKQSLIAVFLLGFFVCVVGVARISSVLVTAEQKDYVQSGVWAIIWSAVAANVGIICACLLALNPLIARWLPSLMGDSEQIPEHCMRIPHLETQETVEALAWPSYDSDATKIDPQYSATTKTVSGVTLKPAKSPPYNPAPVESEALTREISLVEPWRPPPPHIAEMHKTTPLDVVIPPPVASPLHRMNSTQRRCFSDGLLNDC